MDLDLDASKLLRGMGQKAREIVHEHAGADWWIIGTERCPQYGIKWNISVSSVTTFVWITGRGKMNVYATSRKGGCLLLGNRRGTVLPSGYWNCLLTLHLDGSFVDIVNRKIHQALHLKFTFFIVCMCVCFGKGFLISVFICMCMCVCVFFS